MLLAVLSGGQKRAQQLDVFGKSASEANAVAHLWIAGDHGGEQQNRVFELQLQFEICADRIREDGLDVTAGEAEIGSRSTNRRSASFGVDLDGYVQLDAWRVAALLVRFAKSSGEERLQLKWCAAAALVVIVVFIATIWVNSAVVNVLQSLAFVGLWTAIAVAVLKYRLYDIDRVISRTLAYAIITGLLVGFYAGLVLLATHVLTIQSPVAVAVSTLVAAALFNPLRRRVQQVVDRRFNRARYDTDQMVAGFAARLKDTVDLDSVRDDLAVVVDKALEPAHVSVWITADDTGRWRPGDLAHRR